MRRPRGCGLWKGEGCSHLLENLGILLMKKNLIFVHAYKLMNTVRHFGFFTFLYYNICLKLRKNNVNQYKIL